MQKYYVRTAYILRRINMANDIDMWRDIEEFEKTEKFKKLAEDLLKLYTLKFIDFEDEKAEKLRVKLKKKYPKHKFNYW